MKKSACILLLILLVSTLELMLIRPLIPAFFAMTFYWKAVYVVLMYGYPILILLPVLLLTLPFAAVKKMPGPFWKKWLFVARKPLLITGSLVLLLNTLVVFSKHALDGNIFPLVKYAEVQGADTDLEDLRIGKFESKFAHIERQEHKQIETYFRNGQKVEFSLQWLSNSEYRLISQGQPLGMSDTIDVKVTRNFPDYYECYIRFGEYAEVQRIEKR